jgi:hypothetical protein
LNATTSCVVRSARNRSRSALAARPPSRRPPWRASGSPRRWCEAEARGRRTREPHRRRAGGMLLDVARTRRVPSLLPHVARSPTSTRTRGPRRLPADTPPTRRSQKHSVRCGPRRRRMHRARGGRTDPHPNRAPARRVSPSRREPRPRPLTRPARETQAAARRRVRVSPSPSCRIAEAAPQRACASIRVRCAHGAADLS